MEFAHFNTGQTQYLIHFLFFISDDDMISSLTYFMSWRSVLYFLLSDCYIVFYYSS